MGYSLWGSKRVGHNLVTKQQKQQAFPLFTLLYITIPSLPKLFADYYLKKDDPFKAYVGSEVK